MIYSINELNSLFLNAQVDITLNPQHHKENAMVMGVVDTILDDAVLHIRHNALDKPESTSPQRLSTS